MSPGAETGGLVDSHCHLDDPRLAPDLDAVLARARGAGVVQIVVPATTAARWEAVAAACRRAPGLYPAYGLHPMFVDEHRPEHLPALERRLADGNAVAVGECGLDFSDPALDPGAQRRYFQAQVAIARQAGLPLILHARKAVEETIQVLRRAGDVRGVVHSYSGSVEQARQLADLGIHVSLGGPLTHERARRLHALVAALPDWQLLLETDAPDQPDAGIRGQRNEPSRLPAILAAAARLRGVTPEALAAVTTANARRLFGLPAPQASAA